MTHELWRMSAVEAVARLRKREISPLELVEASAQRIAEVEPAVNALPTLCLDRARGLDRRRRSVGRDRRGVAGTRHRPWRLAARPGQPLLGRGSATVAGARDARHRAQPLEPALGAGSDGAQCSRSGALPRYNGGVLPV